MCLKINNDDVNKICNGKIAYKVRLKITAQEYV